MKDLFKILGGVIIGMFLITFSQNIHDAEGSSEQVDSFTWINGGGDIVASLQGSEQAFAVEDEKEIDSLVKVYKTKEKNLIEYIIALEHTNADLLADVNSKEADYYSYDSSQRNCPPQVKNYRQTFTSPYYIAKAQIGDSSYLQLQSFDTVTVLWKRVKQGSIFNRKSLIQLDVSVANPDTKVYGLKAFRVAEKNKRFGIGFQVGYGFQKDMRPAPYIGVGIQYSIFKF
jgi:hypothetical protein